MAKKRARCSCETITQRRCRTRKGTLKGSCGRKARKHRRSR